MTTYDDHQPFRIWAHVPQHDEDRSPWKCVAAFMFLTECLDAIEAYHNRAPGVTLIFQSPASTRKIGGTR